MSLDDVVSRCHCVPPEPLIPVMHNPVNLVSRANVLGRFLQSLCMFTCLACGPRPLPSKAANSSAPRAEPWYSSELSVSQPKEVASAMTKPFDYAVPVARAPEFTSTAAAGDCETYFKLAQQGYSAVSDADYSLLRMEGVRCHALRLGAKLEPVADARAMEFVTEGNALERLPPSVGASASSSVLEARRASADRGESWRTYAKNASIVSRDGTLIVEEGGDITSELTLLAAGDLDGDHQPEFIVRVVGFGSEGNWRDIHLVVLKWNASHSRYDDAQTIAP